MGLSSRIFLLSGDDTLHALAGSAFMRMLRKEDNCRIPDFADQRVRQADLVVEVEDRKPVQVVHQTFCILDIDTDGLLDVERLNLQQLARVEDFLAQVPQSPAPNLGLSMKQRGAGIDRSCADILETAAKVQEQAVGRW
jgi:hypothetical protein